MNAWKCPLCGHGPHSGSSGNNPGDVITLKKFTANLSMETGVDDVVLQPEDIPCLGCTSKLSAYMDGQKKIREIITGVEREEEDVNLKGNQARVCMENIKSDLNEIKVLINQLDTSDTTIKLAKMIRKALIKVNRKLENLEEAKFSLNGKAKSTLMSVLSSSFEASEVFLAVQNQNEELVESTLSEPIVQSAIVREYARNTRQGPVYVKVEITDEAELAELPEVQMPSSLSPIPSTSKGTSSISSHVASSSKRSSRKHPIGEDELENDEVYQKATKKPRTEMAGQINQTISGVNTVTSTSNLVVQNQMPLDNQIDDLHAILKQLPSIGSQHFHKLVLTLQENNKLSLFQERCPIDNTTPLHHAVRNIEIEDESLAILQQAGVDFNAYDDDKHVSILYYAVEGKRSAKFWKKLIELGANPHQLYRFGANLIIVAAEFGCDDLNILEVLLKEYNLNINSACKSPFRDDKRLPIQKAVDCRKKEMVSFLVKHRATLDSVKESYSFDFRMEVHSKKKLNIFKERIYCELPIKNSFIFLHEFLKSYRDTKSKMTLDELLEFINVLEKKFYFHLLKLKIKGEMPLAMIVEISQVDTDSLKAISKKLKLELTEPQLSILLKYAIKGDRNIEFIEDLINLGGDVKQKTVEGFTLLHFAAKYSSSWEPIQFLLNKGLQIHVLDNNEKSALAWAIKANQSREILNNLFRLSFEAGINYNRIKTSLFQLAVKHGNCQIMELILQKETDNVGLLVSTLNSSGNSVLAIAIKTNQSREILEKLFRLSYEAEMKYVNNKKTTLLQLAALHGTFPMMQMILQKEMEKSGFDIDETNDVGETAFQFAIRSLIDPVEKARLLVGKGANPSSVWNNDFEAIALHYAVRDGTASAVGYCLSELGQDPNDGALFERKESPLLLIACLDQITEEDLEKAELLIRFGADISANIFPATAASSALLHFNDSKLRFIELLLKNHVDLNVEINGYLHTYCKIFPHNLNVPNTFIHHAVASLRFGDFKKLVDLLTAYKVDFLKPNEGVRNTVFHLAALNSNFQMMRYLLKENKASVNDTDKKGLTPLHYLVRYCSQYRSEASLEHSDFIRLELSMIWLLQNGADTSKAEFRNDLRKFKMMYANKMCAELRKLIE